MTVTFTRNRNTITLNTETGTITGATYQMKDIIKSEFDGIEWDKATKTWKMDGAEMLANIEKYTDYYTRLYSMEIVAESESTATRKPDTGKTSTGLCPKCGTYCYGDCQAH